MAQASSFSVPEQKTVKARNVFAVIFSGTYSVGTLLLWLTYFMGLVIVYLLTSWLPTLMRDSGASMGAGGLYRPGPGAPPGAGVHRHRGADGARSPPGPAAHADTAAAP